MLALLAVASAGNTDMSAIFAQYTTCGACVRAGYGWCPNRRKCGGFANKECGTGERYLAALPDSRPVRVNPSPPSSGGSDMSAIFAQYTTCGACVGAGYGWCPNRRKCGGFANKECGTGERYVSEYAPTTPPAPRNGLWKSRTERAAEAAAEAARKEARMEAEYEVPEPSPSAAAAVLHAADVTPHGGGAAQDPPPADGRLQHRLRPCRAEARRRRRLVERLRDQLEPGRGGGGVPLARLLEGRRCHACVWRR